MLHSTLETGNGSNEQHERPLQTLLGKDKFSSWRGNPRQVQDCVLRRIRACMEANTPKTDANKRVLAFYLGIARDMR